MTDDQSLPDLSARGGGTGRDGIDGGRPAEAPAGKPEPMSPGTRSILLVEDDAAVREALRTVLEFDGYAVTEFDSAEALLEQPVADNAGFLILDVNLPGMSGLKALEHLRRTEVWAPAVIVSARATDEMRQEARRLNAVDLLTKPIDIDALLDILARACR